MRARHVYGFATMDRSARDEFAAVLSDLRGGGAFVTRRTVPANALAIEVTGIGPLRLPVSAAQAKQLRLVARPAKFGRGEQTVLDRRVRDTWEVPRSRVKIDKRRWNQALRPLLADIGSDLGLRTTSPLEAVLHSMLVYEPGQFFAAHQDSEKDDAMIGSLVVMLPSKASGGDLVVSHRGASATHGGSATALTLVAFYADTTHEVLPVERGYRVVLTYNLIATSDLAPSVEQSLGLATSAASLIERHFGEAPEPRWRGDHAALAPPDRLVFLLDHQYTERGLRWSRLKGDDAARAEIIRHAGALADCEIVLAHADVQETWECFDDMPPRWRRSRYEWDGDSDDDDDDERSERFELGSLVDSSVEITAATGELGVDPHVTAAELSMVTPSMELRPTSTEYTGYMGNWGNTMDRWYRRAAIVLWPTARAFAVRAKGDPLAAINELLDGEHSEASLANQVSTLLRFWADGVHRLEQRELFPSAVRLASTLGDEELVTALLAPFSIEAVSSSDAPGLLALAERHGSAWFDRQLIIWTSGRARYGVRSEADRAAWVETLPDLCAALGANTSSTAVIGCVWAWLRDEIRSAAVDANPSHRRSALRALAPPLLAVLRAAAIVDARPLRSDVVGAITDDELRSTPLLVAVVEAAHVIPPAELDAIGVMELARHCESLLRVEEVRPERAHDDWSITTLTRLDCCDDCTALVDFLTDASAQELTWPLAKPRRQHIHRRIDEAELPVTHHTVRTGSPHRLVLTKTSDLFRRDAEERRETQASLVTLRSLLATGMPSRARRP
jgi:hypothetical protein